MIRKILKSKIFYVFLLALFLRVWGVNHGLPYIFHPDEPTIVRSALGVRFSPNPEHFDWPHFYIYLNFFVYAVFSKFRLLLEAIKLHLIFPALWDDEVIFYSITRLLTAFLGALTVVPVYLSSKKLFGRGAALVSSLFICLAPFHVRNSHYSLPDVPMVFFMSWGVYFAVLILFSDKIKNYLLAGFLIGISASTKYNGGLSAIAIPVSHFLRILCIKKEKIFSKYLLNVLLAGIVAVFGFVVGTPYAVLDYETFSRTDGPKGAFWQFKNVGSVAFPGRIVQFFNSFVSQLPENFGFTPIVCFFVVLLFLVYKSFKRVFTNNIPPLWFLYALAMLLVFYVSGFEKTRAQYYLISYPYIAIPAGYIYNLLEKVKWKWLVLLLISVVPLFMSVKVSYIFSRPDTRNILGSWLKTHADMQTNILYSNSNVQDVLKKYKNLYKGQIYIKSKSPGLFIVSSDDEVARTKSYFERLGKPYKEELSISNYLREGPNVSVYSF